MAQGSSNLNLNLNKLNGVSVSASTGNSDSGTQRVVIASNQPAIPVSTAQPVYGLSGVTIVGTSGQFSCTEQDITPLAVGQQITISGTLSGSGSITGYANPKAYIISQTNGATTFTLIELNGSAITTSTGTTTGLTFFMRGQQDFNIVGNARENITAINNKLSDGSQKSIVRGGAKGSTTAADVTSTAIDTNTQALDVVLKGTGSNTIGRLALNDGIDIGDVTINNASIPVTDNGGSLTVDAPISTPVYVRLSNATSAVDALPVTDNGGSLTVDGSVSVSNFPATQAISGTVTVAQATAANLNATVTGSVSVSNFPATQAVSIATLPSLATGINTIGKVDVNGTVPVSGTFWQATQPVSGTVAISGTVPISGALTDTQLRATAVPVSLASVPSHAVTNAGTFAVQVDGAALTALQLIDDAVIADNTAIGTTKMIAVGGTDGTNSQMLSVNTSGHVNIADGGNSITVDGTFWQATQPVSIATLPALAAGTNNIGAVSFSPNSLLANAPTNASTTVYAASLIVKASAGVLYIITGFNSRSSGQFIQVFDSATLPADTSVPKVIFYVESNSNFSFDLGAYGRAFSSGIVVCNSSTGPTKKIGAADCWFDVQYK